MQLLSVLKWVGGAGPATIADYTAVHKRLVASLNYLNLITLSYSEEQRTTTFAQFFTRLAHFSGRLLLLSKANLYWY